MKEQVTEEPSELPAPEPMGHTGEAPHVFYGGQAVLEGVMMRGADTWAVAARRPSGDIYVETHPVSDFPKRHPMWQKPMLRGVFALFDAMSIGVKALGISANQALADEDEREQLGGAAMGGSLVLAFVFFVGVFILLPNAGLALLEPFLGNSVRYHLVEGVVRMAIFLGYLSLISLLGDIRRVFMYHGAEHKTIAAWEHGEPLDPEHVDRYSTLHVRCGTNFLLIVMLLALIVYSVAGVIVRPPPGAGWLGTVGYHVALRVVLLPIVAGLAYEGIRLGASRSHNPLVNALMQPGLWLQRITTRPPEPGMIEVAIRAFEAVVPADQLAGRTIELPSAVIVGPIDQDVRAGERDDGVLEPTEGP